MYKLCLFIICTDSNIGMKFSKIWRHGIWFSKSSVHNAIVDSVYISHEEDREGEREREETGPFFSAAEPILSDRRPLRYNVII